MFPHEPTETSNSWACWPSQGLLGNAVLLHCYHFVDEFSNLTFVHVTALYTSEEALKAKEAFEWFAVFHVVKVAAYHTNNCRFSDNLFCDTVQAFEKTTTFCSIVSNYQNNKVECPICNIKEHTWTMLLHTAHHYSHTINAHLWPYALWMAVNLGNNLPCEVEKKSPLQQFSSIILEF